MIILKLNTRGCALFKCVFALQRTKSTTLNCFCWSQMIEFLSGFPRQWLIFSIMLWAPSAGKIWVDPPSLPPFTLLPTLLAKPPFCNYLSKRWNKNTNQQNSEVCEVITQARCVVRAAVVFSAAIIIPAAVSICMMTDIKHHAVHTAFIKITGSDQWLVGSGLTVFIEVPVNTLDVLVKL